MAEISIHADAEAEYEAALTWYISRTIKAANGFETAFEHAIESIRTHPERYPFCDDRHQF